MEKLDELIEYYKQKAKDARNQAKFNRYFSDSDAEELDFEADENELLSILLTSLNQFLDYDSLTMCQTIGHIKVIQITEIHVPLNNSTSIVSIYDMLADEEIDSIKLKQPLGVDEFKKFAKTYVDKL